VVKHPHLAAAGRVALLQAACHVIDAGFAGIGQAEPVAQLGGNGRGQRAAGAVRVQRQPRVDEFFAADAIEVTIDHAVAFVQMAALQQHGASAHGEQGGGGLLGVVGVADAAADQQLGFGSVGGDQRGQRYQAFAQRLQRAVFQQACAAGGDHYRVENHVRWAALFQHVGDRVDHLGIGQHAELHRVDVEIVEARVQLRAQEGDRRHMHRRYPAGVLRSQCRDHRQAMHAVGGKGLQIGLDAGATAGIGAGDGQGGSGRRGAHPSIVPWSSGCG